jgi:hypothetical protein
MAIGDAWRLHRADPNHRRVAIGDGSKLDRSNSDLTWGLDFVATESDLQAGLPVPWVVSFRHHRPYIDYEAMRRELGFGRRLLGRALHRNLAGQLGHYIYRADYRPTPAPIRFTPAELDLADQWSRRSFVAIEPFIKPGTSPSKQWPVARFAEVARQLRREIDVYQLSAPGSLACDDLPQIRPKSFREAIVYLKAARLYVGPEGGLHHGAAAAQTRAVVIYGGFTSPQTTGYDFHVNLTGGATYACGTRRRPCTHCSQLMEAISVDEVLGHARRLLVTTGAGDGVDQVPGLDCGLAVRCN